MSTVLTIRIDTTTQRKLDRLARERRVSRSDVVRQALEQLESNHPPAGEESIHSRLADLIGCFRSGQGDLSAETGRRFRCVLRAKRGQ